MESGQFSLFESGKTLPEGLVYRPRFISVMEESALFAQLENLSFRPFEFHGFLGNRRTLSFGWQYVFDGSGLRKADDIPSFLLDLRARAASFAGLDPGAFQHVLLTEYAAGAGIGWHKDRSIFGEVAGISLLSPARLRFRRKIGDKWERANLIAEPRSAYLLSGPARSEWEHSIPALDALRYSITFRNFRE